MLRATSCRLSSIAFELGRLVESCGGNHAMQKTYKSLLEDNKNGWKTVRMHQFKETDDTRILAPRLIGLDVEMVECRNTKKKLPILAAMEESIWYDGSFHRYQTEWKVSNPDVKLDNENFDWKTSTHGVTCDSYHGTPKSEMTTLPQIQDQISNVLSHPNSVLIGHMLCNDLTSLQMCGVALRSKVIDTAFLFPAKSNGGAQSLRHIARQLLPEGDLKAKLLANGHHDPLIDSQAVIQIIENMISIPGALLPAPEVQTSSETLGVFIIPSEQMFLFIGKGGKNFKEIRERTGSICSISTTYIPMKQIRLLYVESINPISHEDAVDMLRQVSNDLIQL